MAQAKPEVLFDAAKHVWQIQTRDSKGNLRVTDKEESITPMDEADAAKTFALHAKDAPRKRIAALTLLSAILAEFHSKVAAWQGTLDPHKGLPNELKGAFLDCETAYFRKFMEATHPAHAVFVSSLPTTDGRGNELTVMGKLNQEAQFQAFLTITRKDPSYGNAKNTVLGYFGYIGKLPMGEDGRLIPPEFMSQLVRNVRIIEQGDRSFRAMLGILHRTLVQGADEGQEKPTDDDLPTIVAMLREMYEAAQEQERAAAERARQRVHVGDIAKNGQTMIERAQEAAKVKAPAIAQQ
jgi:hypothetical protein